MKKLVFVLALGFAQNAVAETLPPGCYVADYYRTDPCFYFNSGTYNWTQSLDNTFLIATYGEPTGMIIKNGYKERLAAEQCNTDYNSLLATANTIDAGRLACLASNDSLQSQYNACETNRQEWIAYGTGREAERSKEATYSASLLNTIRAKTKLVAKLKKACGSKCAKIK